MLEQKDQRLQEICRSYLSRLSTISEKYGLKSWLTGIIEQNKKGECVSTEDEVEMLSRIVNDERLKRAEVPKLLGKSYRECNDNDDFDKIKKLSYVGIYSKVSALLYKIKSNGNKQEKV